mgnify:CR=1 FL=1
MDVSETKKQFQKLMKSQSIHLETPGIEKKINLKETKFLLDRTEIGFLRLEYVSSRFSEYGALFGFYAICLMNGRKIAKILNQLRLSFPPQLRLQSYYVKNSLSEKFCSFGDKQGKISIYEKDDLNQRCSEVISQLNKSYMQKICNFALGSFDVVEDILETPESYAYPMASIVIAHCLNGHKSNLKDILHSDKARSLYDGKGVRLSEIIEKIEQLT